MFTGTASHLDRYPSHLIDVWHARSGARYLLRPILPRDRGALGDLIERLSRSSRYLRFHAVIKSLAQENLRHMTEIDYEQHMALVVTRHHGGFEWIVADARYSVSVSGETAEFAIVVDDACQGRGIGIRALHALEIAAAQGGLKHLRGSVLHENVPMLSMMRRCGFACAFDPQDATLVKVERRIDDDFLERCAVPQSTISRPSWLSRLDRGANHSNR